MVSPGVERVRQRRSGCRYPHQEYHLDGASWAGESQGVSPQRMTDGDVALDGESRDRQNGRRRYEFRQEGSEETIRLAETPWICFPYRVEFRWQTCIKIILFSPSKELLKYNPGTTQTRTVVFHGLLDLHLYILEAHCMQS